ncbi:MAG TPA: CHAT domain-containing protein [Kofleriaceae bacterium]|nr:CHAT domain-containing protein [Kofleriaceae bacterium]
MNVCGDLTAFADGELDPERAAAFRAHLATCGACRAGLLEAMQLSARLAWLAPRPAIVRAALAVDPILPGPAPGVTAPHPAGGPRSTPAPEHAPADPPDHPRRPASKRFRWVPLGMIGALTAIAAAGVLHVRALERAPTTTNVFAALKHRPQDVRFAYGDAAAHHPRDEQRGAPGAPRERISREALAMLERDGRGHALALAAVWNGENLDAAADQLRALAPTPSVRADRAALELLTTSNDNADAVLAELEALTGDRDLAAARAVQWNHALLLGRLDLSLGAARAFREIAAAHEPGWADEAAARAALEDRRATDAHTRWQRADEAGRALVATGAQVPPELLGQFPGVLRAYFYNAVRTAPSRARVQALAAMAAALDQISGSPVLTAYVHRVATADFGRRAGLAAAYAELLQGTPLPAAARAELVDRSPPPDVADIALGALIQLDAVPDHLDGFRRLARSTGDPWFAIVLAEAEATAAVRRGHPLDAEAHLRKAQGVCGDVAITYRCLGLAIDLARLYESLHRIPEAIAIVHTALGSARATGEWERYRYLLWHLADLERFNSSTAIARAYAGEVLLMTPDDCALRSATHRILAGAALIDVDGRTARRHLEAALRCGEPDLPAAISLADIARLDPQPGDLAKLQSWLNQLRASETLTASQRVLADETEGRLVIETDRTAGIALLEGAIRAAGAPDDIYALEARAGSYAVLALDAARHGDDAEVVALIARALGLPRPARCAVGILAEDGRAVVVVRGADGVDHASYSETRRPRDGAPSVAPELAHHLEGCAHVQVMSQADLQGVPRLLPDHLAWSYATGTHRDAPPGAPPVVPQPLVISNVTPPAHLQLPALVPHAPDPGIAVRTLSGAAATPASVLIAMRDASEIQFHTHALVDMGVSDSSYLALSPAPDGKYALTAEAIRGLELRARPIVVLAACRSAQGARYQHVPWSLPHAFLSAGARAVLAAGSAIPDLDAGPVFDRVMARVRRGADPAAALRDERLATLDSNPASWVANVILFE